MRNNKTTKTFTVLLMALIMISASMPSTVSMIAVDQVGNPDAECIAAGFDYGIAKYDWDSNQEQFILSNEGMLEGYNIAISEILHLLNGMQINQ
ncbi:MAG: hypothetical protein ACMXYL_01545 [Candidatus Woesearchaeota archaeon]